jgi:hypothetical protein
MSLRRPASTWPFSLVDIRRVLNLKKINTRVCSSSASHNTTANQRRIELEPPVDGLAAKRRYSQKRGLNFIGRPKKTADFMHLVRKTSANGWVERTASAWCPTPAATYGKWVPLEHCEYEPGRLVCVVHMDWES